jgi:chemotaxis protein CheY-P-specific phosphatase CheC
MSADENMDELQMYALEELGRVGATYTCAALSKLTKKPTMAKETRCAVEPAKTLSQDMGAPGGSLVVVSIDVNSAELSRILMAFPGKVGTYVSDLMFGREPSDRSELEQDDLDAMIEMGDMCIREYLIPIIKFLGIDILPNAPSVSIERIAEGYAIPASIAETMSSYPVRVETRFECQDGSSVFDFSFFPDKATRALTFKKFGVDAESQAETFARFSQPEQVQ